jgi:homeodomain interacting protein kinase
MALVNMPSDLEGVEIIAEKIDRRAFVSILKDMLQLDQERRLDPDSALKNPFVTMSHLVDYAHLNNVRYSFQMMEVCYNKKSRLNDSHAANVSNQNNSLIPNPFIPPSNPQNMTLAFNGSNSVPFNSQVI